MITTHMIKFLRLTKKENYNKIIIRFTGHVQKILNSLEEGVKKGLTEAARKATIISPNISSNLAENKNTVKLPQYSKPRVDTEISTQHSIPQINEIKPSKKPDINYYENNTEISNTTAKTLKDAFGNPPLQSSGFKSSVKLIPSVKYNDFHKRGYASTRAGTFDPTSDLVTNQTTDKGTPIQGDVSGYHQNVVVTSCSQPQCKTTNCADSTKLDPNPCGKDPVFHKGPLTPQQDIHNEFIGTLTHKVPKTMVGQIIDPINDIKGPHPKGQSMAVEKSVSTVDISQFNQNAQATTYIQENSHTKAVLTALPADSVLNI